MTSLPNPFLSDLSELFEVSGEPRKNVSAADSDPHQDEIESRFVLDEVAFMEAIEEMPMFLRRAS